MHDVALFMVGVLAFGPIWITVQYVGDADFEIVEDYGRAWRLWKNPHPMYDWEADLHQKVADAVANSY